jgi:hypothetical protein
MKEKWKREEKKSLGVHGGMGTVAAKVMTLQAIRTVAQKQIYWEKGALWDATAVTGRPWECVSSES